MLRKTKRRLRAQRRREARTVANQLTRGLAASQSAEQPQSRSYCRHQSILDRLAARSWITERQRDAGARLAIDHRIASGGRPRLVLAYDQLGHGAAPKRQGFVDNDGPAQLDARRRFEAAIAALGRDFSPVVIHAVVADQPVGDWAALHRRPCGFAMKLLRQGLDALISHYQRPVSERLRLAAAAAPRSIDVPMVALPSQMNGKAPTAQEPPAMPTATGSSAFYIAQALEEAVDDRTLTEAIVHAADRGWLDQHVAAEDVEMAATARQFVEIARGRDSAYR